MKLLLKDFAAKHSVTSVSKDIGMSRQGTFKVLKKLESEKFVILSPVGSGKTSAHIISLNWDNPLVEKTISIILTEEALKNQRWISNFSTLEGKVHFLMIYGSILSHPKEAKDIDILGIADKKNFLKIDEMMIKTQKTQIKKIHALNFTEAEFKNELKKPNKAFIDAIKNGVVLFGQERFISFMRRLAQ